MDERDTKTLHEPLGGHHKDEVSNTLRAGDTCIYSFGEENASRATVEIVKLLDNGIGAEIKFLSVEVDDTGNYYFTYLLKTGYTMNASLKYLTRIERSTSPDSN